MERGYQNIKRSDELVWTVISYLNDGHSSVRGKQDKLEIAIGTLLEEMLRVTGNWRAKDAVWISLKTTKKRRKTLKSTRKAFRMPQKTNKEMFANLEAIKLS
ncbi:hypothetical protein PoB_000984900 [Plakobranchus ocellatus]|uniref:RUN domain-containing protein n=1 Tax=Plakobranchus ocellatus TaxID=259542 RepID=A0AAV3YML6_9GAST|nr:hypothetical protein PoB_000984900 [Plakobranchus ocellatus]